MNLESGTQLIFIEGMYDIPNIVVRILNHIWSPAFVYGVHPFLWFAYFLPCSRFSFPVHEAANELSLSVLVLTLLSDLTSPIFICEFEGEIA